MALDIVDALVRSGALDVIAVDSVPALEPVNPLTRTPVRHGVRSTPDC
jgi:RecA/RadA recombinase